jgi:hypothetical protein
MQKNSRLRFKARTLYAIGHVQRLMEIEGTQQLLMAAITQPTILPQLSLLNYICWWHQGQTLKLVEVSMWQWLVKFFVVHPEGNKRMYLKFYLAYALVT